jgi:hypothetical protein
LKYEASIRNCGRKGFGKVYSMNDDEWNLMGEVDKGINGQGQALIIRYQVDPTGVPDRVYL